MPKNITISSFKKLPGGFLICLALFLAMEWFLFSNRAFFMDDFWNKIIVNEHELIDMPGDRNYLIIGDSLQKTGIDPRQVSDSLLNLGLPGAKPMGQYLLLKRYLEKHRPPKAIFLYIDPEDAQQSMSVILRYFVSIPEFISVWSDLNWQERSYFLTRYWESLDMRTIGGITRDRYKGSNKDMVKTIKSGQGYIPTYRAVDVIDGDYFRKTKFRYATRISISARDMKYLDKLMALAKDNNIKVVFLGMFLPGELDGIFRKSGFIKDYMAFLETAKNRYPEVYFLDEPIKVVENRYFADISHVNTEGAGLYTGYFKDNIFGPYTEILDKKR
jgi:hypothetical protein